MSNFVGLVLLFLLNGLRDSKAGDYIRKPGYCMWYGQCGRNPTTATHKAINCFYNGPARKVDKPSREILAQFCPEFSHPDSIVCCDFEQLVTLLSGMHNAEQMMARCPSCWKNFRELYCQMTCSPNNSLFMDPTHMVRNNSAITGIAYYVDKSFKDGLYNSCKNVLFPSTHERIMNFMCGTTAEKCTPEKFLTFMGDPEANGVSPFLIQYPVSYDPSIKPMNSTIKLCNESFFDPFTNTTKPPCSHQDCMGSSPINPEQLTAKVFFSLKPGSEFNKRTCYKNFYSKDCVLTGTILRFEILNKVLEIQAHLINMSASSNFSLEKNSLGDFCIKPMAPHNNNCIVLSVLQYWQNDAEKLNKCISVLGGVPCSNPDPEFSRASWGDHLASCVINPVAMDDGTALHLPCNSLYGGLVLPEQVLGGYDGKSYTDASMLYVTFVIKKNLSAVEMEKAKAWQKKFVDYLKNYHDDDLQLAYVPIDFPNTDNEIEA